ncbi:hypothetical protein PMAYCL1PPCAC_14548, partial [Pristionchus mayeri]
TAMTGGESTCSSKSVLSTEVQRRQELIISKPRTIAVEQQQQLDMEQKLAKKEDMYQRACRAAREADSRAERAEELLDAQNLDGLTKIYLDKKLSELSDELEKE